MRLLEAIIDANHRALAGDQGAGLHPSDFAGWLPLIALTCVDPRLNRLMPEVLGIPEEQFIWLRNAGNILTSRLSSTMRSLSLSCAVKGGREIAIIGHTDCQMCKTTTLQLLERFKELGIERHVLPENINEYFGLFGSERQNVIKACEIARSSPLIGPGVPVHGLLVDIQSGKLDWIVNGYESLETFRSRWNELVQSAGRTMDAFKSATDFQIGEMKFPETRIGEIVTHAGDALAKGIAKLEVTPAEQSKIESTIETVESAASIAQKIVEIADKHWPKAPEAKPPPVPPKLPHPLPPRPRLRMRRGS